MFEFLSAFLLEFFSVVLLNWFCFMFCYVETDYMIAGPPMSFGMMKGKHYMNTSIILFFSKFLFSHTHLFWILGYLWGFLFKLYSHQNFLRFHITSHIFAEPSFYIIDVLATHVVCLSHSETICCKSIKKIYITYYCDCLNLFLVNARFIFSLVFLCLLHLSKVCYLIIPRDNNM